MKYMILRAFLSSGGSTTVTANDWSKLITDVTAQFSVSEIVTVMSTIIVAGIGFVFLWWGARKAYRALMKAVTKGRTGF